MATTGGESKSDAESDVEQYELTEDEEDQEEKTQQPSDSAKRPTGKRKRSLSQNDEEEIARRRRKRRSLAFQQQEGGRRRSQAAPTHSKQYISDMYSTIIKMSSENKINVKNSWSLHLIDHMEDILDSCRDDTYNFQKASCTLDASIKIYSYRVDDTWNSSYKILENLSRRRRCDTSRKTRKTHARTIEKNLNNINLKAYDTECEADPLFHKMSQSFDEGGQSVYDGCKILLNSSDVSLVTRKPMHEVADKSKEKSEDQVKEKSEEKAEKDAGEAKASDDKKESQKGEETEDEHEADNKEEENADVEGEKGDSSEDATTEEEQSKGKDEEEAADDTKAKEDGCADEVTKEEDKPPVTKTRISLSIFGNLSCLSQDVQNLEVCPPLYRMYDQLDEFYGDEARHKLGIKNDFLLKTPVKGRRKTLDKQDIITMNLAGIMEGASEDESDGEDTPHDTSVDFGDDNAAYDADEDGADTVGDAEEVDVVESAEDVDMEKEKDVIDLAGSDDEGSVQDDLTLDGIERGPQALDKESSLKSSAADFFRAKVNENLPENYEDNLFSQMIESALVRSANVEDEQGGEDLDGKNDYSYFDVKMLRNWAGPGHWKFPAVRKMKQRVQEDAEKDGLDGEVDEDGVAIKAEPTEASTERVRKGSTAGVDKKATTVDFFGDEPDLSRLKAPKSASSLEVSKGNLKKQAENASDLVLPVDTHIELSLFFRHFLKERTRFFRKRGGALDGVHREDASANDFEFGDSSGDTADGHDREQPFTYNEDSAGFEPDYDEDEGTSGVDDPAGPEALYSVEGLVQADRVVEKIGVHYERFAKRVDVKKLKGSIWDHLEKKVIKDDASGNADDVDSAVALNESGKRPREHEAEGDDQSLKTTFENVVENVAGKVPSNVTVSFYFICVLHLANEKGLELKGQDDLRNFQIRKETS
ncbi:Condensin complex subunit 2/barren [Phytophthora cactorum]|nr:Condensin complex subunit 2/barren [Phytophthora cactorum]